MPVVFFDLFGTLASLEPIIDALKYHIPEISDHKYFFQTWWSSTLRDYMSLCIQGSYRPILEIAPYSLNRSLEMVGLDIEPPRQGEVIKVFQNLPLKDGVLEAVRFLHQTGWTLYILTNGPMDLAINFLRNHEIFEYFSNARSLPMHILVTRGPDAQVISCDNIKKVKPDPEVYTQAKLKATTMLKSTISPTYYMVSNHSWDTSGARKCGIVSVWVGEEEKTSCTGIFGRPDVRADTILEAAQNMISFEEQIMVLKNKNQPIENFNSFFVEGDRHPISVSSFPTFANQYSTVFSSTDLMRKAKSLSNFYQDQSPLNVHRQPNRNVHVNGETSEPSTPKRAHGFGIIHSPTVTRSNPSTPRMTGTLRSSMKKGTSSAPLTPTIMSPPDTPMQGSKPSFDRNISITTINDKSELVKSLEQLKVDESKETKSLETKTEENKENQDKQKAENVAAQHAVESE